MRLLAGRGPVAVEVIRKSLRMQVRGLMDLWLLKEVCIDGEYDSVEGCLPCGTLLDIGAGLGEFCVDIARRFPGTGIVAFEPCPATFGLLERNIAANDVPHVVARSVAVGPATRTASLHWEPGRPHLASTVRHPAPPYGEALDVPVVTLENIVAEAPEGPVVIKMDCEGAEYDILAAAPPAVFSRVAAMALEVHEPEAGWSRSDLVRRIAQLGFDVEVRPNRAHRHLGIVQARKARQRSLAGCA